MFTNLRFLCYSTITGSHKTVSSKPRTTQSRNQAVPSFEDLPEKEKLIQNVLEMLAEIPEDNLVRYGHQMDDMILSCHFNNMECLYVEFTAFFANKAVDGVLKTKVFIC